MEFIDYYKVLGVDKKATADEIKKAFRKLARKYHPDVNSGDANAEKRFKEINEANEVLGNPENRKKYDKYGKDWKHADEIEKAGQQKHYQQGYQQQGYQQGFGNDDFSDFFESMFGGGSFKQGGRSVKYKGQDYNAELQLSLEDVYETRKQVLTVNNEKIRLTIPAGVENGQVIKIAGKGGPGKNGGPHGDLYIKFSIADHPIFKREGNKLFRTVDLDLYTALLGGELITETMSGNVKLKITPETQNGTRVKLKGKGFPIYKKNNQYGDLSITLNIVLPTQLSDAEKKLFQELKKLR